MKEIVCPKCGNSARDFIFSVHCLSEKCANYNAKTANEVEELKKIKVSQFNPLADDDDFWFPARDDDDDVYIIPIDLD